MPYSPSKMSVLEGLNCMCKWEGNTSKCETFGGKNSALGVARDVGRMFYIVSPEETSFSDLKDVPNYYRDAWPYFLLFIILENVILWIEKKPTLRLNDTITSLSHGFLQESGRLLFRGAESYAYVFLHENFKIVDLPWDSALTWYLAALGVDFCYYWVHRACHEVHILWAQHQVHHSSEEFNLPVGLRQSILQGWCGFVFYLPLSFFIPPTQFIAHQHLNLLYQFWIHTTVVKSLGPLEYVFNTPQHHRVHHGSNLYCLDKNYGGVLIIWDRIFGTYAQEKEGEEIVYGLVFNQPSFNPLHLQTFYTKYVIERIRCMRTWKHKLAVVFYGPSWQPGKPRLGLEEDKVKVTPRAKYDVKLPNWRKLYILFHFIVSICGFYEIIIWQTRLNAATLWIFIGCFIYSLIAIGLLLDNHHFSCLFELLRCILLVILVHKLNKNVPVLSKNTIDATEAMYLLSALLWVAESARVLKIFSKLKSL